MRSIRFRLVGLLWLVLLAGALALSGKASARPSGEKPVVVSFTMESPSVSLHEPVFVDFSVHNDLQQAVAFDLGPNRERNFDFSIVEPNRSTVAVPQLQRGGMSVPGKISLPAGETYRQKLLLNQWYQFGRSGDYKIEVTLATAMREDSGVSVDVPRSQEMLLHIGPRDANRLEVVCKRLAREATSPDAETALFAARALSYVQDLVAAPYLGRLTREGAFVAVTKQMALQGLARLADAEGLDSVVARLSPEDRKLAPVIKSDIRARPQILD